MRDYSNMPVLKWEGSISAKKAMAQIHHAEPVIIQLPDNINLVIDASTCGCDRGKNPAHHLNCNASNTLKILAQKNAIPELEELATIAHEAGQVVDIETDTHRIIIHD